MSLIKERMLQVLPTVAITLLLLLVVDFTFGNMLLGRVDKERAERKYRIKHPTYHHTLAPGFDGYGVWGTHLYKVCTNPYGFKSSCSDAKNASKDFDLAFIGDSFTEGIGLPYEQTFVGKIAEALPKLRVANFAVATYSPSIYLAKIKQLLDEGFRFQELVIYIDISDIQDEAVSYQYENGVVRDIDRSKADQMPRTEKPRSFSMRMLEKAAWAFPLTSQGLSVVFSGRLSQSVEAPVTIDSNPIYAYAYDRGAWTYFHDSPGYGPGGVQAAVKKSIVLMDQIYLLLKAHNIKLSIGVYPWPSQILHDVENSRQVNIWQYFCNARCSRFYNSFPTFFKEVGLNGTKAVVERFYFMGDVHYNAEGAVLISRDFLSSYRDK